MDKTSQKVTKDPTRQEALRERREKYINKLKESISNDAKKGGEETSNVTNDATNATTSATTFRTSATARSSTST